MAVVPESEMPCVSIVTTANVPPVKDATAESDSAQSASPFFAIGLPSSVVTTARASPGTFNRMEEIRPPYVAPSTDEQRCRAECRDD